MALNRLVDAELDARNPRTAGRELPSGALTRKQVVGLSAAAFAVYLVAVFQLDPIVRWLWPIPVAMFVVYPYLKRFTWLCHLWLGACLGLAPVGAWLAVSGTAPWEHGRWARRCSAGSRDSTSSTPSTTSSTTGGRGSTPGRCGSESVGSSSARGLSTRSRSSPCDRGRGLGGGRVLLARRRCGRGTAGLRALARRPGDLRRLDAAFFTVNGVISLVFLGVVALDVLV